MKRLFAVLLFAVLLCVMGGCAGQKTQQDELTFTMDNYPVIEGSTANLPLGHALARHFLGMTQEEAESFVRFNKTDEAYWRLLNKDCDLLIVYEASEETKEFLDEQEAEFDYYEIGLDALVFIVSTQNPVKSVAAEDIVSIYSGKTTNWKDLGGDNLDIVAFQRPDGSGSQTMMQKLVMKDTEMMEAPTDWIYSDMMGLIEGLAEYANEKNAIGYSVFYYANYMYSKPDLQFLAVNDIVPSNDAIQDGSYPFVNPFYAVVRSDERKDSPARQLAEWLSTPNGKALMEQAGYVPTKE
jgi:ABC-type phosphate transport system, periplasmic component